MSNQKFVRSVMYYVLLKCSLNVASTCLYQWCHFWQGHSGSGLTGFWCIIKILTLFFIFAHSLYSTISTSIDAFAKIFFFSLSLEKNQAKCQWNEMNRRVGNSLPSLIMESVEKTCSKHSEIMLHICCFDVIYSLELLLWLLRAPRRYQRGRNWKLTPIGQEAEQLLH